MKKVMVTKGLRGKKNPQQYHEVCMEVAKCYYRAKGESVEFTSGSTVTNDFQEKNDSINKRLWSLGKTIQDEISVADEIVFMDDWEKYDGPTVEHVIAVRYGIPCIYLQSSEQ